MELANELSIRRQHLHAVVAAIADDQVPLRIERECVRLKELARTASSFAELTKVFALAIESHNPMTRDRVAMSFGDEDVTIGQHDEVVRLIERCGIRRLS